MLVRLGGGGPAQGRPPPESQGARRHSLFRQSSNRFTHVLFQGGDPNLFDGVGR
jgi:hypothetical protein